MVKGIFIRQKSRKTPRKAALAAKSRFAYPPEPSGQKVDRRFVPWTLRHSLVINAWSLVIPGFADRPSKRMISLPSRFSIHQNPSSNPRKAALAAKSRFQKNPQATDHGLPAIASAKTGQTPTDQPGNVDSRRFPELSNLPTLNLRTALNSSHQNSQKRLGIPRIPPNPTSPSHQNVDSRIWDLALGHSLVIRFWALDIPSHAGLSLQKIKFSRTASW